MSENLNNLSLGGSTSFRIADDADNDLFTVNRPVKGLLGHKNIPVNPFIIWQHEPVRIKALEHADRLQHASSYNSYNFAFHPAAGLAS
ncbi:hypothetical protein D3C73_1503850 [compost metagenome]